MLESMLIWYYFSKFESMSSSRDLEITQCTYQYLWTPFDNLLTNKIRSKKPDLIFQTLLVTPLMISLAKMVTAFLLIKNVTVLMIVVIALTNLTVQLVSKTFRSKLYH